MPVGCLSANRHVDSTLYIREEAEQSQREVESLRSQVESISLMQQTLLLQIFRCSDDEEEGESDCPTCQAFSNCCCQGVHGLKVFQDLQEANVVQFWNAPLVKAIIGLRYQGYVCPGILVTLCEGGDVRVVQEAWSAHALATPPGYRIYRLGLSGGCSVTPFQQAPTPALPETLCWVLARLKEADCVADMSAILACLGREAPAFQAHSQNLPALVHAALGSLIKARKVYYTGKGYFLVLPPEGANPSLRLKSLTGPQVRNAKRDNSSQTESSVQGSYQNVYQHGGGTTPPSSSWSVTPPSWASSPAPPLGHQPAQPAQQHRMLTRLNSLSPPTLHPLNNHPQQQQRHSPCGSGGSPCHISPQHNRENGGVATPKHSGASDSGSNSSGSHSSPDSSMLQQQPQPTLERSQSLRVSKKSMRKMAKGGSLRLSKKDAVLAAMLTENGGGDSKKNGALEDEESASPPKKMERKNSFLGRIFGRKKSASSSSSSSGGSNGSPKKEILTFSGQFPPPELELARQVMNPPDLHSVETQTPPHQRRKPMIPTRPFLPPPQHQNNNAVPTAQLKNGPNGNYIVYEREFNGGPTSRPLPQSPPMQEYGSGGLDSTTFYGENNGSPHHPNQHIYSQPNSSIYGGTKPPPPAYSSAPPYRPKDSLMTAAPGVPGQWPSGSIGSPAPARSALVTSPKQHNGGGSATSSSASPQKQVHFAASPRSTAAADQQEGGGHVLSPSPGRRAGYNGVRAAAFHSDSSSSSGQSSSLSGPSSLDSVLYDDSLIVIEKSNQDLELRLSAAAGGRTLPSSPSAVYGGAEGSNNTPGGQQSPYRTQLSRHRIDTIHNNRHLDQEVIYEDSSLASSSRSSSQSTLKPDHPSLSDLGSILDLSAKFQSLTARKLIAGLSISSIDTLLEVNTAAAAADNKNNNSNLNNSQGRRNQLLDESTETIDFGVI